jgi:hypothetical protein
MNGRRLYSGMAGTALVVVLTLPAAIVSGQTQPSPAPSSRAEENAAIVTPLAEIGRVHSRTPYCGALARARAGIDSAITFEYSMPIVANDLRRFRLDSHLTKAQSLKKTERDLTGLWNLAVAGRDDVRALRTAANAEGVDEQKRKEMLDFADALDGAKARQMMLAKSLARVVAVLAETPVRDIANTESDNSGGGAMPWKALLQHPSAPVGDVPPVPTGLVTGGRTTADDQQDHDRLQGLFGTLPAEDMIRKDLKDAAQHGSMAMRLGGCAGNN